MNRVHKDSINETLFYTRHDTGLNIYIIPKPEYSQVYGVFAVNYGSNDSEFVLPNEIKSIVVPDGIAHFLEHKMFEKEHGNVFDDYAKLGSSPNAYTNFTTTAYTFTSTGNIKENIELLLNSVQNPYFTDESVEKEKGIIEQEIKMYQDNPNWRVYFNLLDCLYIRYPAKKEIAGSIDSIQLINKELLYDCYRTFYRLSNSMFLLVGDVSESEVYNVVDSCINKQGYEKSAPPRRVYPHEPAKLNKNYAEQKLSVSQPLFAIGFKDMDIGFDNRQLLKKELETSIILEQLFGRSTFLYKKLYNEGLINNTFGSDYTGEKDYGYSVISGESKDPLRVSNVIEDYIKDTGIKALDENNFERIKRKFVGQFLSRFNSVEYIGSNFVSYYMKNIDLLDYLDVIEEINYHDIVERCKNHMNYESMAVSVILPA